jgi:hypothetical protein
MGVFSKWQPRYAAVGIATIPVDPDNKVPMVKHWQKFRCPGSTELASKPRFQTCNGIAFRCGARSGITILDIDVADEHMLRLRLKRHGDSPVIEQTASGKFHVWYRHNGEQRKIRPWGKDEPVDLVGDGLSIACPTKRSNGDSYRFFRGSLDDVPNLPAMGGLEEVRKATQPPPLVSVPAIVKDGERNDTLFKLCLRHARRAENVHQLTEFAMSLNATFAPPLSDAEAMQCALNAWKYEERGQNFMHSQSLVLPISAFDKIAKDDGGDALILLSCLKRYHWDRDQFVLANQFATTLGWTLRRYRKARDLLVEADLIRQLTAGGRFKGDAPLFAWPIRKKAA